MTQSRPFSKLKKQIENLFVPELKMKVNCFAYPMRSQYGSTSIPRYYIQLAKNIIWDFPKDFPIKETKFYYWKDYAGISDLIREYIDTPVLELPKKSFKEETVRMIHQYVGLREQDEYDFYLGLTDIFKVADRRLGKEKLLKWCSEKKNPKIQLILNKRFTK